MSGNQIVAFKLTSSGKIDETFKPCQTMAQLYDVIYEARNPSLILSLSDANELLLFQLVTSKAECQTLGKLPLSQEDNQRIFDSVTMFGPLIVARNNKDASLHLFQANQDDMVGMLRRGGLQPAIYQLPECTESTASKPFIGGYYVASDQLMAVEVCPGQILTIQSTLKASSGDEDGWFAFFLRHSMKFMLTLGLIGTGAYQYWKMTKKKKEKEAEKEQSADRGAQGGQGRQNQRAGANQRGYQQRGRQAQV